MIGAEAFRDLLIEIEHIDRDVIECTGICPDTAARMMRDPIRTFRTMTIGERKRFWPLVEASLDRKREHRESVECAQILAGESSRFIEPTDGSHP
jgi:hypothetical protein